MSIVFWKNILKCLPTTITVDDPSEPDHSRPLPSSSSSSKSPIVIKNFNSLYDISSSSTSKSLLTTDKSFSSSTNDSDSNSDSPSPPDFSTVFASQRFFFTSPGHSNSILQTSEPSPPPATATPLTGGGVAFKKYSPDPYADFKKSMQEMIEAREVRDVRANWEYLHELLSCYLALNPRQTHHIIITAFVDIVICLLSEESGKHRKVRRSKKGDGRGRRHQVSR